MTASEKKIIIENVGWCINRVRREASAICPDYDIAADDVCNKLAFMIEWIRMLKIEMH